MSRARIAIISIACLSAARGSAVAQQISAQISSQRAEVGEVLTLRVTLSNFTQEVEPTAPESDDFEIRPASSTPSRSERSFFDGRKLTRQIDLTYAYLVRPLRQGRLVVPSFTVSAGGRSLGTDPIRIEVENAPLGTFFLCEVKSSAKSIYVGQPLKLTLLLWARTFQQGRVSLSAQQMLNQFNLRQSLLGVFGDADLRRVRVVQRRRAEEDGSTHNFYVYSVDLTMSPSKSGPLDFGRIELLYNYPIELERSEGFGFLMNDRWNIARSRVVVSQPELPNVEVKAIPLANRPPDFNGALGQCTIAAEAKPTSVPVGDPITLTLTIRTKGDQDQLSAPRLDQVEALTRDFEVPPESLAGEVGPTGKVFNLTIRPLHEDVTEVPPIPMSYFDPQLGKFGTAWSAPIPLTVTPAERLTLSLDARTATAGRTAPLVETTEGLLANFADPQAVLSDQSGQLGVHIWGLLGAMPVVYLCTWLVQRRVMRLRSDASLRRRSRAYAHARRALRTDNGAASRVDVAGALLSYIADRCNVPSGGMTRADAARLLGDRAVPEGTARAVNAFLESLEQSQYGRVDASGGNDHVSTARKLVDELERLKLK